MPETAEHARPERSDATRLRQTPESDFEVAIETLKNLAQIGALRRMPSRADGQLVGSRNWLRYHRLDYRNQSLTLWTTDNRCTLFRRVSVDGRNGNGWSAVLDAGLFCTVMRALDGSKCGVLRESSSLRLGSSSRVIRIPLFNAMEDFPLPFEPAVTDYVQIPRLELMRTLTFLAGTAPASRDVEPSDLDKTQTVSLFRDGFTVACGRGTDRVTRMCPLPFDVHVSTGDARRLTEWLKLADAETFIAKIGEGDVGQVLALRDNTNHHRLWIPLRRDPGGRVMAQHAQSGSLLLAVQVDRRAFSESIRLLSPLGSAHRILLQFSGGGDNQIRIRLSTSRRDPGGWELSGGDADHVGTRDRSLGTVGDLRFRVSADRLQKELSCFDGNRITLACRRTPTSLSFLATGENHAETTESRGGTDGNRAEVVLRGSACSESGNDE